MDGVERGRRATPAHRLPLQRQPAFLARGVARPCRRNAAALFLVHGAGVRRPHVDRAVDGRAARSGDRPRTRGAGSGDRLSDAADTRAVGRHRRRQLRVEHGQHQLLLSHRAQGCRAGMERGSRQPGGRSRTARRAARRRHRPVRRRGRRCAVLDRRHRHARRVAAERRLRMGPADRRCRRWRPGSGWTISRRSGHRSRIRQ